MKLDESKLKKVNSPNKLIIKELDNLNEQPTIFDFIAGSDYVAIGMGKRNYVGKVEKQDELDVGDYLALYVHSLDVEKLLCSRESLLPGSNIEMEQPTDFHIVIPPGKLFYQFYKEGHKYLFFLTKVPEEEKLSSINELDKNRTYFRVFEGEISILPNEQGGFHSPSKMGAIELGNSKYQEITERIEILCSALSVNDKNDKIENLQDLAKSDDEVLRTNASFAIEFLQKQIAQERKP